MALSATSGESPAGVTAVTTIPGSQSGVGPTPLSSGCLPVLAEPTSRFPFVVYPFRAPLEHHPTGQRRQRPQTGSRAAQQSSCRSALAATSLKTPNVSMARRKLADLTQRGCSQPHQRKCLRAPRTEEPGICRTLHGRLLAQITTCATRAASVSSATSGQHCPHITTVYQRCSAINQTSRRPSIATDPTGSSRHQPAVPHSRRQVITGAQDSAGLLADEKQFVAKAQSLVRNVTMSTCQVSIRSISGPAPSKRGFRGT